MLFLQVGIREAKAKLSELLKEVQQGHEVILTDRGRPIGKIVPMEKEELSLDARLQKLEAKGLLHKRNAEAPGSLPAAIVVENNIAQTFLLEEREIGR